MFAKITSPALSKNREERYVQISFLADGCVDIMVAYLRGEIEMSFDELENTIMSLLKKFM